MLHCRYRTSLLFYSSKSTLDSCPKAEATTRLAMPGGGDEDSFEPITETNPEKSVKKFTWRELSRLNSRHNAHVAYRGKVSLAS